ncbi:hypothetical protein RSPO_m01606 (plasmid) [Ralstonia solanacearum Po82]|uniref:Uncharacterized protein n=1 Tax=Ralstonia solanacearum (strain Po82) TaxID=1031711 RepID=F6GB39_RALS8|nr:hypothetical protein RSPO_m01606 [Ralstonia solanacearum Po82]
MGRVVGLGCLQHPCSSVAVFGAAVLDGGVLMLPVYVTGNIRAILDGFCDNC